MSATTAWCFPLNPPSFRIPSHIAPQPPLEVTYRAEELAQSGRSALHMQFVSFTGDRRGELSGHTAPGVQVAWIWPFEYTILARDAAICTAAVFRGKDVLNNPMENVRERKFGTKRRE